MTVVAVVDRDRGETVVLEAVGRAEEHGTDLHVVYVLQMGGFGMLELDIADLVGIPVGLDVMRERCASIANGIAAGIADEYEAVGLVGDPAEVIPEYVEDVDADCIVVDSRMGRGIWSFGRSKSLVETLREGDVPVVPV